MKIVIVDDTLANLLIVRKHVELLGHTAISACNGLEALAVFEREKPDGDVGREVGQALEQRT